MTGSGCEPAPRFGFCRPTLSGSGMQGTAMIRLIAILCVLCPTAAFAQAAHEHAMPVNAVGGGLPYFCSAPTATAIADGAWSAAATWSGRVVPSDDAKVVIPAGRRV